MGESALKTSTGALFIQRGGANKALEWLGCANLDEISESEGGVELIQCFNPASTPDNPKWDTVGKKYSPPDPISTSVETLLFPNANALEKVRGVFALYALSRIGGKAESFANYVRGRILTDARRTSKAQSNLVHRNEDEEGLQNFEIEASPPGLSIFDTGMRRQTQVELKDANSCYFLEEDLDALELGLTGWYVAAGNPAAAKSYRTADGGDTWTASAADPFGATESIMSVVQVAMDATTFRTIVVRDTDAGGALEIAYTDDSGATWTLVSLSGAVGEAAAGPRSLFALDRFNIWLVTDDGWIYKSEDAGQTWSTQDEAVATAGAIACVHFYDQLNGVAGAAADVVLITSDGGQNWDAVSGSTGGGGDIDCIWYMEDRIWVGTDDGELWYSEDLGVTWTERTGWVGSGVGTVADIAFYTDYIGFMLSNTAAPVGTVFQTINGGFTWEPIDTPSNSGLSSVFVLDPNTAYVTGLVNAATAYVAKVSG